MLIYAKQIYHKYARELRGLTGVTVLTKKPYCDVQSMYAQKFRFKQNLHSFAPDIYR